ncbi:NYN domain-containing protein, partial [Stutzerimonas stutzeri]
MSRSSFPATATSHPRSNPCGTSRQNRYIDALTARGGVSIDYGHFLSRPARCRSCGAKWQRNEEKKTDVNIAVRLLEDAFDDLFDVAIIVSGDSDLAPPI